MMRMTLVLFLSFLSLTAVRAQEGTSLPLPELLEPVKLPKGYQATTRALKTGDKSTGHLILIINPDQLSKVLILIETRDRKTVVERRAATKGYVNGFSSSMAEQGYKVIEKNLPDIANESFVKPISVGLVFANGDGKKLWTHQEIFFTDKGFAVQVVAEDSATLASLTKWAKTIKPKAMPK